MKRGILLSLLVGLVLLLTAQAAFAGPLPGAIFTTLKDGSAVNANTQYQAKEDVYLDGGPGPHAPVNAAGLPEGDYYFQVTDPSGKVLLSVDPVASRKIHVNGHGVIDKVYPVPTLTKYQGKWYAQHQTGTDLDHGGDPWNAITVQLMPYENTPNNGGVYKVWVTPCDKFDGDPSKVDNGYRSGYFHGFIPAWSKTDNYKVKAPKVVCPKITVKKFHDKNANGVWDSGEPELNWEVDYTKPLGDSDVDYTPFTIDPADAGDWSFTEIFPDDHPGWEQTALYIDGVAQPVSPTALLKVLGTSGETHTVVFGNVRLVCVKGEKYYDKDADGEWDDCEKPMEGIKFHLTGTAVDGSTVDDVKCTDEKGFVYWHGLLPGTYTLEEIKPVGDCWFASTETCKTFNLCGGEHGVLKVGNYCVRYADFNTKGFWHNKNGLDILAENPEWIAFVNGLDPYKANPFDGLDSEGNPVAEAKGPAGETIAGEGTALAEISEYLVDSNAGGDPKIQLGQQLLAFIFNAKATSAGLIESDGGWMSADDMIDAAIDAWNQGGDAANEWAGILDGFNNNDAVKILSAEPCEIRY